MFISFLPELISPDSQSVSEEVVLSTTLPFSTSLPHLTSQAVAVMAQDLACLFVPAGDGGRLKSCWSIFLAVVAYLAGAWTDLCLKAGGRRRAWSYTKASNYQHTPSVR